MLERRTLNLLCGGPSSGKTTLTYQSIAAHCQGESFNLAPCLEFPPGDIVVINGDRTKEVNDKFFTCMGITNVQSISLVDDRELSDISSAKVLRKAINQRLQAFNLPDLSAIILDLYDDYYDAKPNETKKLLQAGRLNLQWAQDLNVAILGLAYPYKGKGNNRALRQQDRFSGAVHLQGSASWKFILTDKAETGTHWIVDCIPPPMGGKPVTYDLTRQDDIDLIGRFMTTVPPSHEMSIDELQAMYGVKKRQAFRIRAALREEAGLRD